MKKYLSIVAAAALAGCCTSKTCATFQQMETPSTEENTVSAGHKRNALLGTSWERGKGQGVRVYLPTDTWGDGVSRSTAWRLCEFDENGQLQKVHPQTIRTETVNIMQLK